MIYDFLFPTKHIQQKCFCFLFGVFPYFFNLV